MMKCKYKSQFGSVLLEAVVAMGVIVIVVTAMAVVVTISLNNANFIRQQDLGNKYAQEGIEQVRYQEENNYKAFSDLAVPDSTYTLDSNNQLVLNMDLDAVMSQGFHRRVTLKKDTCADLSSVGSIQADIIVSWAGGKCDVSNRFCHSVHLATCLTPSIQYPAP